MTWQQDDDEEIVSGVDGEDPDPSDQDAEDEPEVIDCPYCGKSVHEQSEWCNHCGKYLSEEDVSPQAPKWVILGTVLGILAVMGCTLIWLLG